MNAITNFGGITVNWPHPMFQAAFGFISIFGRVCNDFIFAWLKANVGSNGLYYFAKRNETKRNETKSGKIEQN